MKAIDGLQIAAGGASAPLVFHTDPSPRTTTDGSLGAGASHGEGA